MRLTSGLREPRLVFVDVDDAWRRGILVVKIEIEIIDEEDVATLFELIDLIVDEYLADRIIDVEVPE